MAPRPLGWAHLQLLALRRTAVPPVFTRLSSYWWAAQRASRRQGSRGALIEQMDGGPLKCWQLALHRLWEKVCPNPGCSWPPAGLATPALTYGALAPRRESGDPILLSLTPPGGRLLPSAWTPAADLHVGPGVPGAEDAGVQSQVPATWTTRPATVLLGHIRLPQGREQPHAAPQSRRGHLEVSAGGGEWPSDPPAELRTPCQTQRPRSWPRGTRDRLSAGQRLSPAAARGVGLHAGTRPLAAAPAGAAWGCHPLTVRASCTPSGQYMFLKTSCFLKSSL